MTAPIDAILFDMGGTLHRRVPCPSAEKPRLISQIMGLIDAQGPPAQFAESLTARAAAYRRWSQENLVELNESDLWTRWMLPDQPAEKIAALAPKLNHLWRATSGSHVVFPETQETILALFRRGYRLGVVSNTTSSLETPRALEEWKLSGCFEVVCLSCDLGIRKPSAEILLKAARRMGVQPGRCAYVGDRLDRDVPPARAAGFANVIIRTDPKKPPAPPADPAGAPDALITNLQELLEIFPARRHGQAAPAPQAPRYDAALSTMWGMHKFAALEDFFTASQRLGFAGIELNHQVAPAQLEGIDLRRYTFRSIHEPCPAHIPANDLKKRDLLISSPDEERRRQGVLSIRRSIDLAHDLGAALVVVHCGQVQADGAHETELRRLVEAGKAGSPEFLQARDAARTQRSALVGPCLEAVRRSLKELLEYAGKCRVRLGLENRYHLLDIPGVDEMGTLLELADSDRLGFLFDFGHARALDLLGFYPELDWLERFSRRIIGIHIHDVSGINDHRAPGLGDLDFRRLAAWLPADALRTLELAGRNTYDQIKNGLELLVETGCIKRIQ